MIRLSIDLRSEAEFRNVLKLMNNSAASRRRPLVAVPDYAAEDRHVKKHYVITDPERAVPAWKANHAKQLVDAYNASDPEFDVRVTWNDLRG